MWDKLTPRERVIANSLLQAMSNSEIAKAMNLELGTVKSYVNKMFCKYAITTGCKRVKLVVLLYRESRNV